MLLVDDVLTTGATTSECAGTLKRAGAKRVYVATATRRMTVPPGSDEAAALSRYEVESLEAPADLSQPEEPPELAPSARGGLPRSPRKAGAPADGAPV